MTGQEFKARYQLLKKVSDGRLTTYHALASNGAVVMVHLVEAGAVAEFTELLALIDRLSPDDRQRVLLIDDVDDAPLIVTRFLLDFHDLREWLHATAQTGTALEQGRAHGAEAPAPAAAATPDPPAEAAPAAPEIQARQEDSFTSMFASPAPQPRTPDEAPPAAPTPGEFTRMFRAPDAPAPPVEPSSTRKTAEPVPGEPATRSGPGEFTQIFGSVAPPEAPSSETSAPPVSASSDDRPPVPTRPPVSPNPGPPPSRESDARKPPGEFTRVFGSPATPREEPQVNIPAAPISAPPAGGAGDFTRVFGAPQRSPEASPSREGGRDSLRPHEVRQNDDYLSRLGGAPPPVPSPVARPGPPPGAPTPEPSNPWNLDLPRPVQAARQSEFTRVVAAQSRPEISQLPAGVTIPAPGQNAPAAAPPSKKWLFIGLVLVAVAAIAAVVLLVIFTR